MAVGTIQPIALSHLAQECLSLVISRRCHSALYWRSKRNFLPEVSTALSLACKSYLSALGAGLEGHCEREDHQLPNRFFSELNSSLLIKGFRVFQPSGNRCCAASSDKAGTMMTSSPGCQLTGVATWWAAVSCSESRARRISSKFRPVLAGEVSISLIFLSGPITNTERTVMVSLALGWIIP